MTTSEQTVAELLLLATTLATEAGAFLLDGLTRARTSIETKSSGTDMVSEMDKGAETLLVRGILAARPNDGILGEEGTDRAGTTGVRWVIDPLDGTGNYVHRFPYYCVSIGLEYQSELVVGVIYDPTRDELFSAMKGSGAFLNGQRIRCSEVNTLPEAMCMASLPVKTSAQSAAVGRFLKVISEAQSVQRSGSAALNLCYVASGRVDAFWSTSLKPWDMAAGVLIVQEAGGRVTNTSGAPFVLELPDLLATNGTALHGELSKLLVE